MGCHPRIGGNLYLQCTIGKEGNVRRSWLFKYEFQGKRHEFGLGPLHTVGLGDAELRTKKIGRPDCGISSKARASKVPTSTKRASSPVQAAAQRVRARRCASQSTRASPAVACRHRPPRGPAEGEASTDRGAGENGHVQACRRRLSQAPSGQFGNPKHRQQWRTRSRTTPFRRSGT